MNERIKLLAEQADLYARSDNSSMLFENYKKRYSEKFAELIVKDCAETVQDFVDHRFPASEYPNRLKKYFGVE